MKIKEALQRIGFTISKQNKPNATDAEAFNKLLWFVNESIEHNPNKNILFAKLYLYNYRLMYQIYGNDEAVQNRLHRLLELPIDFYYNNVKDTINTFELRDYLNGKGIKSTHLEYLDKPERELIESEAQANIKTLDRKEFIEVADGYDLETIKTNMNALITLALKSYTND